MQNLQEQNCLAHQKFGDKNFKDVIEIRNEIRNKLKFIDELKKENLWQLAESYHKSNRSDEAIVAYRNLLEILCDNNIDDRAKAYEGIAQAYIVKKDWKRALEAWEEVLSNSPKLLHAQLAVAIMYMRLADFDKSENLFRNFIENNPNDYRGYEGFAKIAEAKNDIDTAILEWQSLLEKFPHLTHAKYELAKSYIKIKDFSKADLILSYLVKNHPESYNFLKDWYYTSYIQSNWEDAKYRFILLMNNFPYHYPKSGFFFYFLYGLKQLNEINQIYYYYMPYLKMRFREVLNHFPNYDFYLEKNQIKTLNHTRFETKEFSNQKFPLFSMDTKKHMFLINDESKDNDLIMYFNDHKSDYDKFNSFYRKNDINDLEILVNESSISKTIMPNFLEKKKSILVHDPLGSWFHLGLKYYLNKLREMILQINPDKVICVGKGSGGYLCYIIW